MPSTITAYNLSMNSINNISFEERFFNEPFFLSYSSLNKLLYSPKLFYKQYVLGQKEEKLEAHLVEGKLIHCFILEPDKFSEQFIIAPGKVPKDNAKIIVDSMFSKTRLQDYENYDFGMFESEILELMMELNYYQNLKTDAQRLEKVITDDNINYFQFLKQQSSRILIDDKTYEKCKEAADELLSNPAVIESLFINTKEDVEVLSEHQLRCNIEGKPFGLKGFIDRMVVDHNNKRVHVRDLKSSSKTIDKFRESVEYYRYDHQAAFYHLLAKSVYPDYDFNFNFVVIDIFKQTYVFEVSKLTLDTWTANLVGDIEKFNWHFVNKNFNLPYEMIKEKLIL